MADFVRGLFGGSKPAPPKPAGDDADFADYADAPPPEPASISSFATPSSPAAAGSTGAALPYTKWYRVWERTTLNDFRQEMYILPFILVVVFVHLWGTRTNRRKANGWIKAHAPVLRQEYVQVGYWRPQGPNAEDVSAVGLRQAVANQQNQLEPERLLKEKALNEFSTYATGRQNVAFTDFKVTLAKRYNPLMRLGELGFSLFFESMPATQERLEATSYLFDGREDKLVPKLETKVGNSNVDGFVFAIVHKDLMKRLRDDRYDLSLTTTKDHPKLPVWTTVMSESAEVTDTLLTPELIKAVQAAGEALEALVVTDQPMDQPKKLDDTVPKKRASLSMKLSDDYSATLPLFQYFLRLPDQLVSSRFRPEALRRIKQTRDEQIQRIKRVDDEEKAEERKLLGDKAKKEKRDSLLKNMSAEEQRKYLDKEREKGMRKSQKRQTMRT